MLKHHCFIGVKSTGSYCITFHCAAKFIFPLCLSDALNSFFFYFFINIFWELHTWALHLHNSHASKFPCILLCLRNSYPILSPMNIQHTLYITISSLDMCACLTTLKWLIYVGALLRRALILSQYPLTTCSFSFSFPFIIFHKVGPCGNSPSMPVSQLVILLFRSCSCNHIVEILWLPCLDAGEVLVLWLLQSFWLLFEGVPLALSVGVCC